MLAMKKNVKKNTPWINKRIDSTVSFFLLFLEEGGGGGAFRVKGVSERD